LRSALRLTEEGSAFIGIVTELMTEDAKGAQGVAKTAGDVARAFFLNEECAEASYWRCKGN
jgi:hypothetical protein